MRSNFPSGFQKFGRQIWKVEWKLLAIMLFRYCKNKSKLQWITKWKLYIQVWIGKLAERRYALKKIALSPERNHTTTASWILWVLVFSMLDLQMTQVQLQRLRNPGRHCEGIKSDKLCKRAGRKPNKGENARLVGIWPPKLTLKITRGSVLLGSKLGSN